MLIIERIKRLLAIIILMCFFLPLSQCTAKAPVSDPAILMEMPVAEVFVPVAVVQFKEFEELIVIAIFVWPLVVLEFRRRVQNVKMELLINFIEIIFSAASIVFLVYLFRLWNEVLIGGIIAFSAFSAYLLTCSFILCRHVIRKFV